MVFPYVGPERAEYCQWHNGTTHLPHRRRHACAHPRPPAKNQATVLLQSELGHRGKPAQLYFATMDHRLLQEHRVTITLRSSLRIRRSQAPVLARFFKWPWV
jgi:hypothetical protein